MSDMLAVAQSLERMALILASQHQAQMQATQALAAQVAALAQAQAEAAAMAAAPKRITYDAAGRPMGVAPILGD